MSVFEFIATCVVYLLFFGFISVVVGGIIIMVIRSWHAEREDYDEYLVKVAEWDAMTAEEKRWRMEPSAPTMLLYWPIRDRKRREKRRRDRYIAAMEKQMAKK